MSSETVVLTDRDSLSGPVTLEKWECWKRPQHFASLTDSNPDYPDLFATQNRREFALLSQSDLIVRDFFTWSVSFRKIVELFILDENPIQHIEVFVRLAGMIEPLDDPASFRNDRGRGIDYYLSQKVFALRESATLESWEIPSSDFAYLLSEYDAQHLDETKALCQSVVLMLALVHGVSVVEEVLRIWTKSTSPGTAAEFALVVEDWENFKQYPVEWIVNLLRESP